LTNHKYKHTVAIGSQKKQMTGFDQSSNRQANLEREEREQRFAALADFANLGETPDDWRRFRSKHPHFFPETPSGWDRLGFQNLTEWLYTWAESWAKEREQLIAQTGDQNLAAIETPLLWYRDRLRAVWTGSDPDGANLKVLYGFEKEASGLGALGALILPGAVPGQPPGFANTLGGLPKGQQVVIPDNIPGLPEGQPFHMTGRIGWKFGCTLQQAVYELMQSRWRMKVCPVCNKFFVASKTAQKHCSPECYRAKKEKQSLDYYYSVGQFRRQERHEGRKKKRGK
jgi:hypothetical protein